MVDSGSQITIVSEEFYNSLSLKPHLFGLEELGLNLNIHGAGGHNIPCIGCIVAHVRVPFMPDYSIEVGAFVVPMTKYGHQIPVIIGKNVISRVRRNCDKEDSVPNAWKDAFVAYQIETLGVV